MTNTGSMDIGVRPPGVAATGTPVATERDDDR